MTKEIQAIGFPKLVADNMVTDLEKYAGTGTKQTLAGNLLGQHITLNGFGYCGRNSKNAVMVTYQNVCSKCYLVFWTSSKLLITQLEYLRANNKFPVVMKIVKYRGYYKFK